ncbi:MAG: polyphosphate kinase 2 family protein [Gemmatimonadota bacterium]|jgi:PPK2 family polyphosphate:nucleotide phosphotransferase|nr:polyphosphate kinase 2 family protein [Gemmatimonadota bacterium]
MLKKKIVKALRVEPGSRVDLRDFDPGWAVIPELAVAGKAVVQQAARDALEQNLAELAEAQELLWANDVYSVLVILQAMDAAGKDGTIKHVMSGINPQGCQVFSFKVPSAEELDHNFLWRYSKALPERGRIGIFNRSYYEEVLVVKVHPEILEKQRLPAGKRGDGFWQARYDDINRFERHLSRNGTLILKFFLNISKDEQKRRFLDRLDDPAKQWKFSLGDLAERQHWDAYQRAFEDALSATSTKWAPWYVIPADHKWAARTLVAEVMVTAMRELKLKAPAVSTEQQRLLAEARQRLAAESS